MLQKLNFVRDESDAELKKKRETHLSHYAEKIGTSLSEKLQRLSSNKSRFMFINFASITQWF